jgi:hypothetical protein
LALKRQNCNEEEIPVFDEAFIYKKGKNAIELPSKIDLEPTLQSIKKAVNNGEFDRLLEEQLVYGSHLIIKQINSIK